MSLEFTPKAPVEVAETEAKPDFSECFESVQQIGDKRVAVCDDVLNEYLTSHMDYLKQRFASVLEGPEAHKFAEFFSYCQELAGGDNPAYAMMFGDRATHLT